VAVHCGLKIFGMSVITDMGVGDDAVEASHEEVQKAAALVEPKMMAIMREMINRA
jgi:purine-nucleoside phosphorylase